MKLHFSLRVKFVSLITLLLVAVFSLITIVRVHQNQSLLRANVLDQTKTFAALTAPEIASLYSPDGIGRPVFDQRLTQMLSLDKNVEGVSLLDSNGAVLARSGHVGQSGAGSVSYYPGGDLQSLTTRVSDATTATKPVASITYYVSNQAVRVAIHKQVIAIITFSAIGTVVSGLAMLIVLNQAVIVPVKRLSKHAGEIANGVYAHSIQLQRHDEIGELYTSIASMQHSLQKTSQEASGLNNAKSEFMMIASHTLRTPIAAINATLDAVSSEQLSDKVGHYIEIAKASTQRLDSFAEDLLVVSNLEVGQASIRLSSLPVSGIFDMLISYAKTLAVQKSITFQADVPPLHSVYLQANRAYLMNAVWNIVDNALKFTGQGGQVKLAVSAGNGVLSIRVDDDGIGIPADEIGKIFEKFHRGTSTEQYNYEGSGIGLFVSQQIVAAHNGTILVDSQPGSGSSFTIQLPATVPVRP